VDGSREAASPEGAADDGGSEAASPDGAAADAGGDGESSDAGASDAQQDDAQTSDAGRQCLPDGSGSLRFRTTGALTIDDTLGDSDSCNGAWNGQQLIVTYFVPVPVPDGGNPTGILSIQVDGLAPGATVSGKPVMFSQVGPSIWDSPVPNDDAGLRDAACSVDITLDQQIGTTNAYKVQGSVHCSAPVPNVFAGHPALQVDQFDFVIRAIM
jgi:hypothetical protein